MSDHAETWRQAMKRARALDPQRLEAAIVADQPNGLRAARYDSDGGGRTTRVECRDESCEDGPPGTHSHHVVNDPTGNAATRGRHKDAGADDLLRLDRATRDFVQSANGVLWWVCGDTATTWAGVVRLNAKLMPGTVRAGLDVDDDYRLPPAIAKVDRAVSEVERIAREHQAREPSTDERHWTDDLADEQCCSWHLAIHERYRRPRAGGTNACASCLQLAELLGQKPPQWLIEAQVDYEGRPMAWRAALSRCMDELGIVRESA